MSKWRDFISFLLTSLDISWKNLPLPFVVPLLKGHLNFICSHVSFKKNLTYTCPFLESQSEKKRATLDFRVVQEPPNAKPERWIRNRSMNVSDTVKYIFSLLDVWYFVDIWSQLVAFHICRRSSEINPEFIKKWEQGTKKKLRNEKIAQHCESHKESNRG